MVDRARQFRHLTMQGLPGEPDDAEQPLAAIACPPLGPVERRALGIGVDQQHGLAGPGELAGEVQRDRRLAGAPFLGQDRDDHRRLARGK